MPCLSVLLSVHWAFRAQRTRPPLLSTCILLGGSSRWSMLLFIVEPWTAALRARRGPSLVDLSLTPSNRSVNFVPDLVNCLPTAELSLHHLVGLQKALQFTWELIVLRCDQVHVLVECIDFALFSVRFSDLTLVWILEAVELVLQRLQFTRSGLQAHLGVSFADLELFGSAHLVLVSLD